MLRVARRDGPEALSVSAFGMHQLCHRTKIAQPATLIARSGQSMAITRSILVQMNTGQPRFGAVETEVSALPWSPRQIDQPAGTHAGYQRAKEYRRHRARVDFDSGGAEIHVTTAVKGRLDSCVDKKTRANAGEVP